MTVALPWSSVGLSTGYRGNPRVSTAEATAQGPLLSIVHGASTACATVVAMTHAAVLSVATSVVPVEICGFPPQGPRLSIVHGASTASATVVAMAHVAVMSVATSVVPTMATHGSTTATAAAYSLASSMS